MRVLKMNQVRRTKFRFLTAGDCFYTSEGNLMMKVNQIGPTNAVMLNTGEMWKCDDDEVMITAKAHVRAY